ncbi:hypothetical protein FACS1894109_07170 [Spirochaetia bacterium]|nr:hypothetical protein FACS1894109_07170 [Spirochaetia bacterium]
MAQVKSKPENWYLHRLSSQELEQFIDEARNGKENKKAFIGAVEDDAANRIKAVCGKDVSNIMLESEGVRHSYKRADHNLRDDDLLHIVDIINTATDIKLSITTHQNNECIEISKDMGEKITLVMELRIHYGGWLALVTCYRHKI